MATPSRVLALLAPTLALGAALGAQTTTWLGDRSSDWHDPANWTAGVPTSSSTAVIQVGGRNRPDAYGARCAVLQVRPGAGIVVSDLTVVQLTMEASSEMSLIGQLTVSGPFDNQGRIDGYGSPVQLTGSGDVRGQLPEVEVRCTDRRFVDASVEGELHHTAGVIRVRRLNIQLDADFAGTTVVSDSSDSYLIIGSSVTWHTRSNVTDPPRTIDVYGNWDMDPNDFAATAGVVVFRGSTSLTGSGSFHGITVASGSSLSLGSTVIFGGPGVVHGSVSSGSGLPLICSPRNPPERISGTGSVDYLSVRGNTTLAGISVGTDLEITSPQTRVTIEGTVRVGRDVLLRDDAAFLRGDSGSLLQVGRNCECGGHYELLGNMEVRGNVLIMPSATVTPVQGRIVFKAPGTKTLSSTAINNPMPATVVVERGATLQITSVQNFGSLEVQGTVNVNDWSNGAAGPTFARGLTVAAGGVLTYSDRRTPFRAENCRIDGVATIRGAANVFAGNVVVNGTLNLDAGASVRLEGQGVASGTFPALTVGGNRRELVGATINGDLDHVAGGLEVGSATINGGLSCRGQYLAGNGGTNDELTVAGDIVVETSAATTNPPAIIRARRNWRSSPTFQPRSGTVVFENNASGHNAQGTAGNDVVWNDMQVGAGNTLFLDGDLLGRGITVSGLLSMTGERIELGGALVVDSTGRCTGTLVTALRLGGNLAAAGVVELARAVADVRGRLQALTGSRVTIGGGVHRCGNGLTVTGSGWLTFGPTSTFVFDGDGRVAVPVPLVLPAADFTGPGPFTVDRLGVAGNLQQRPGAGSLGVGDVRVGGSALLLGGPLADAAGGAGVLDVTGGVLMAGAGVVANAAPEIRCGAEWAANRRFAPASGKVVMTGVTPALTRLRAVEGELSFHDLELRGPVTTTDVRQITAHTCRIAAGGGLVAPGGELTLRSNSVLCDGTLAVPVGGRLVLGPVRSGVVVVTIGATGRLWLVGDVGRPARIHGTGPASYALNVAGGIDAAEFEFRDMNAAGIRILANATIGAPPLDLRGGVFGSGAADAGAVLLDVARSGSQPLTLHGLVFDNRDHTTRYNVRSRTTTPIRLTASDGNFWGAQHEDDPNQVIDWAPFTRTELEWIGAEGGLGRVDLSFRSLTEVDAQALGVLRGDSPSGPFDQVAGIVVPGGAPRTYAIVDRGGQPLRRYYYQLVDAHTRVVLRSHGVRAARSYPAAFGPVRVVGATGFGSIGAALAGAGPGTTILVESGTYPAFRVTEPVAVRALPGARVRIDASSTPVSVDGVAGPAALHDLEITAAGGPGLLVRRCPATIVLDGLTVRSAGPASTAIVEECPQVALQWSDLGGGLTRLTRSVVYAWGGSIGDLHVLDRSRLVDAALSVGRTTVDSTSTRSPLPGSAPRLSGTPTWRDSGEAAVEITTNPGDLYVVLYSLGTGFYDLSGIYFWEMVLGLGLESLQQPVLAGVADPRGSGRFTVGVPAAPELWGLSVNLQMLSLGIRFPPGRFSSLHRVVLLP